MNAVAPKPPVARDAQAPLRGGFSNPIPSRPPERLVLSAARVQRFLTWENVTVAPPFITIFPIGENADVRAQSLDCSLTMFVDEALGLRCAQDFQDLIFAGLRPFVDLEHRSLGDGAIGIVNDLFYCPLHGVRAEVAWSQFAEQMILSGECTGFSPCFHMSEQGDFDGIEINIGALVKASTPCGMPRLKNSILPVTKLEALELRASRFLKCVSARARELGTRWAMAEAESEMAEKRPGLFAAFQEKHRLDREEIL